ncbi:MAG: redox-regulated ATPase YchF, partial [Candidatus Dadabacteria bacterium]
MGFKCGIVGLPNVGKSTIFNALTAAGAQAENFPFCTIEPNTGVVPVPDERLEKLAQIYNSKEVIPTKLTFVDVAGLIKGASKGEGLGNQFLGHIRNVDAIAHVVRCFQDENVVHIHGEINPISDIEIIETELVLADLELTEKQIAKYAKLAKSGDKKVKEILANLERLKELLSKGVWLAKAVCELELDNLGWFFPTLLTVKPLILVANVSEESLNKENDPVLLKVREYAESRSIPLVELCGELEAQLSQLELEEKKSFLQELNIKESGLEKLIKTGYSALNLITFFTAGPKE